MPLQQAKTPIHIDLVIVCKKRQLSESKLIEGNIIRNAVATASGKIEELGNYVDISFGDAKVALIGRLLCELSLIGELDRELGFLEESEGSIESYSKTL